MLAIQKKGNEPVLVEIPNPVRAQNEALIRLDCAGICATDLEILKGYLTFEGILGHEFVGTVLEADDKSLEGKRVVGNINCGCGECSLCRKGDPRHCPDRTTLGIVEKDGAFAEMFTMPEVNLVTVPETIPDEEAVFAEPVAAALEITEQVSIPQGKPVLVMGDGRLGTLVALVLREIGASVTISGRVPEKLAVLESIGFKLLSEKSPKKFDVVVDATGSPTAISEAITRTAPRGHVVLKTTTHASSTLDLSRLVIDEITIVGSRCGPIDRAIEIIARGSLELRNLITATYELKDAAAAFTTASLPESFKVLLKP